MMDRRRESSRKTFVVRRLSSSDTLDPQQVKRSNC
jgi:hypothetical protein